MIIKLSLNSVNPKFRHTQVRPIGTATIQIGFHVTCKALSTLRIRLHYMKVYSISQFSHLLIFTITRLDGIVDSGLECETVLVKIERKKKTRKIKQINFHCLIEIDIEQIDFHIKSRSDAIAGEDIHVKRSRCGRGFAVISELLHT